VEDANIHKRSNLNKIWEKEALLKGALTLEEIKGIAWNDTTV
jgi:hypothetical protein